MNLGIAGRTEPLETVGFAGPSHSFADQQKRIFRETWRMWDAGGGIDGFPFLQDGNLFPAVGRAVVKVHAAFQHRHVFVRGVDVKFRPVLPPPGDEHQRIIALPQHFHVPSGL